MEDITCTGTEGDFIRYQRTQVGVKCHFHELSCSPLVFSSSEEAEGYVSAYLHVKNLDFCDAGLRH